MTIVHEDASDRRQGDAQSGRRRFFKTMTALLALAPVLASGARAQDGRGKKIAAAGPGPSDTTGTAPEVHPGWVRSGRDDTPGSKAYYINLEAKPGHGDQVQAFLRDILAGVRQEPGTGPWFGCRFSDTTFGVFEAFPDMAARNAHDVGPGGRNFLRSAELEEMLSQPARLYRLDVMFGKYDVMLGRKITS